MRGGGGGDEGGSRACPYTEVYWIIPSYQDSLESTKIKQIGYLFHSISSIFSKKKTDSHRKQWQMLEQVTYHFQSCCHFMSNAAFRMSKMNWEPFFFILPKIALKVHLHIAVHYHYCVSALMHTLNIAQVFFRTLKIYSYIDFHDFLQKQH